MKLMRGAPDSPAVAAPTCCCLGMPMHLGLTRTILYAGMPLSHAVACRELKLEEVEILLNVEVIALNQDPLGVAGDLIAKEGPQEVRNIYHRLCDPPTNLGGPAC